MSVLGLTILVAQIALGLAAFRLGPIPGLAAIFSLIGGAVRAAQIGHEVAQTGDPLNQRQRVALLATSTGVAALVVATFVVVAAAPLRVVTLVVAATGLDEPGPNGPRPLAVNLGVVAAHFASLAGGAVLGWVAMFGVAAWIVPVAPDWRRGIRPPLILGLVGALLATILVALLGWAEDSEHTRRVEGVARLAQGHRLEATQRRECLAHITAGRDGCDRCGGAGAAVLEPEAARAERQAEAEAEQVARLEAQGRARVADRWFGPRASVVATLGLLGLAAWGLRLWRRP